MRETADSYMDNESYKISSGFRRSKPILFMRLSLVMMNYTLVDKCLLMTLGLMGRYRDEEEPVWLKTGQTDDDFHRFGKHFSFGQQLNKLAMNGDSSELAQLLKYNNRDLYPDQIQRFG